jgi:hypothetical protein
MKMVPSELQRFKDIAEKAFQAEIICALLEDHPHRLIEDEVSAIASLLKKLSGDVYVFMNSEIYNQENNIDS